MWGKTFNWIFLLQSNCQIIFSAIFRDEHQGIADIFVKKGPFLKLYSSYIRDFETMTGTLDEALKKYPAFQTAVKEFEVCFMILVGLNPFSHIDTFWRLCSTFSHFVFISLYFQFIDVIMSLTLSVIQQFCSRQLWTNFVKK